VLDCEEGFVGGVEEADDGAEGSDSDSEEDEGEEEEGAGDGQVFFGDFGCFLW
jgi:hypothetical protein